MNVVITGASRGIGKAIAYRFAKEGNNVATCARKQETLDALKKELNTTYPDIQVITYSADVSIKEEVDEFARFVLNEWAHIDLLVNNAGTFIKGLMHKEDDAVFEQLMHTNLFSAYYMTKRFVKGMVERKNGHVINIGSVAGIKTYLGSGSYSISKFGMLGFTRALRDELKPFNIRVTAILPGAVLTDSWKGTSQPEERFMSTEDVAEMVWSCYSVSSQTNVEEIIMRPMQGDLE